MPDAGEKLMWTDVLGQSIKEWPGHVLWPPLHCSVLPPGSPTHSAQPKNERQQRHPLDIVMRPVSLLLNDLHFYCFVGNVSESTRIFVVSEW